MILLPDAKRIAKKAWSSRLIATAAVLSGGEAALPLFVDFIPWPRWASALLVMAVVVGAFWARLVAQPKMWSDK